MGDNDITRIFNILDTIREQFNKLLGRAEEKEKRCEEHNENLKNMQTRLANAEARLTAIESGKTTSSDWITKLLAVVGILISVYAALKH